MHVLRRWRWAAAIVRAAQALPLAGAAVAALVVSPAAARPAVAAAPGIDPPPVTWVTPYGTSADGDVLVYYQTTMFYPGAWHLTPFALIRSRNVRIQLIAGFDVRSPYSYPLRVSDNGRYVVFVGPPPSDPGSAATPNVPFDTYIGQLTAYDLVRHQYLPVSVDQAGQWAGVGASGASISADGRYVAFVSTAPNLKPGRPLLDFTPDVYVRDLRNHTTTAVDLTTTGLRGGGAGPAISADGRYIAFVSGSPDLVRGDTNAARDIFVRDLWRGTTELVSRSSRGRPSNADSAGPSISGDGRYVEFESAATTLTPGQHNATDVYIRDRRFCITNQINLDAHGRSMGRSSADSMTSNGRYALFSTLPPDGAPPDLYVRDLRYGTNEHAAVGPDIVFTPRANATGRYLMFATFDHNLVPTDPGNPHDPDRQEGYLRDRWRHITTRLHPDLGDASAPSPATSPTG
jgi:Tol biopolymer transport system component